jgi:UDP-N-acetylglucosamine transferase subunit ALG13
MIFVTVGSSWTPFDRLLAGVDSASIEEAIVVQHGPSAIRPAGAICADFLPYETLVEHVEASRAVVTHAGVGSIMVSLLAGKVPIVVPRLHRFGEAVDDHQVEFARLLASEGLLRLVEDTDRLPAALMTRNGFQRVHLGSNPLVQDLHEYLAAAIGDMQPRAVANRAAARRSPAWWRRKR